MKIYKYSSHEEYVDIQTKANIRKLNNVWVDKETISKIYEMAPIAAFILCHGTRNAAEQKYFKHFYPYAEIIGTEISHTASKFEMTIQHDFHEIKEEWINKFDIIYSNSFDHSYDPVKSLTTWKNQLSDNGSIFVETGIGKDNKSSAVDPLELNNNDMSNIASSIGMKIVFQHNIDSKLGYKSILNVLKRD